LRLEEIAAMLRTFFSEFNPESAYLVSLDSTIDLKAICFEHKKI
jgi:hypothetical protein